MGEENIVQHRRTIMSLDAKRIGARIRKLRVARGLSQAALKKEIKCGGVSKWETGGMLPTLRSRVKLAEFFKVSIEYISCDGDERFHDMREMALEQTKKALEGDNPSSVVVRNAAALSARAAPDAEKSANDREEEIRQLMRDARDSFRRKLACLKDEED
jgi:transcriptional regulator with XRE-family HTH domain